ncbi:hypothetical protein AUJ14_02940 [Candidatus Micrarchaeota archaeon CG1_02_55_22]|nr:MAG: hypothetical protein AUJ14_02940 [Candidatus Micrarchaeota archaeon CG1_02_55_22]
MTKKIVVLGGGVTGLSTAWKLSEHGADVLVLEKKGIVGGVSGTFSHGEYRLDYGPHKIYTQIPGVLDEYKTLLGADLNAIPKNQTIRVQGKYYNFPVKIQQLLLGMNPLTAVKCGASYAAAIARKAIAPLPNDSYENYLRNRFGDVVYSMLFEQYAWKVWGDPKKLSADLARKRISVPSLFELVKRVALGDQGEKELSASTFFYPERGFQEVSDKMVERITNNGGRVVTGATPTAIRHDGKAIIAVEYEAAGKKQSVEASHVISTIPIGELPPLFSPSAPADVVAAGKALKWRSIILVFMVVDKPRIMNENWIFFPEADYAFNRVSEQKGFNDKMVPADKTVVCAEVTCDYLDEKWRASDAEMFERVIPGLEKSGLFKRENVKEYFTVKLKDPYPVYDIGYEANLTKVIGYLDSIKGALTIGRMGLFNYNNTDHCIDMGRKAADYILSGKTLDAWQAERKKFDGYLIVD